MNNSFRSPTYLVKNPYSYCFRMNVPADLQFVIGKKELRYSLRTGYLGKAKSKARILASMVQQLFQTLRGDAFRFMELSDRDIQNLVLKYLDKIKADYDKPAPFGPFQLPPFESDRELLCGFIDSLGERGLTGELKAEMASGDYSKVIDEARFLLADILPPGDDAIDEDGIVFKKLCAGLMRAEIKGIGYHIARLSGEYGDDLEHIMDQSLSAKSERPISLPMTDAPQAERTEQVVDRSNSSQPKNKKLSEVIPLFVDEMKVRWKPKTKSETEASLALFIEVVGDTSIQSINRATVAEYKATLKKLPPNKNKTKKYQGKTIAELVDMPIKKTLSVARVNKNLQRAGALFDYAINHGIYEGPNPATKMQLPKDKWDTNKRAPFTNNELNLLFRSDEYINDSFSRHYMFWTPIIALFHGMRQNEIAGLFIEDIKQSEDGVWYFDLFSRKSTPNTAYRVAPIHPFLIEELNFLTYCREIKDAGGRQLFPECTKTRDGYAKKVSRWFNGEGKKDGGYKKKCGIVSPDDRMRDFHSFRTTFITRLRHKKVHDRQLKAVVGHSVNVDTTDDYTDPYPVKQLYDEIMVEAKFDEEIDLSHLKKSRFVIN